MTDWGKYAPAIERWAEVIDRPAPEPTDDKGRLNPELVEWMMGYPEGWTEGVSRTGQLKALGNAIVPHQAAAAWGHLLGFNVATHAHTHTHLLGTPRVSSSGMAASAPAVARGDLKGRLENQISYLHQQRRPTRNLAFAEIGDLT